MVSPAEELRRDPQFDPERHDFATSETVGDLLRRTREGYGQDLSVVAAQLRIRNSYLRAIEEGRFRDLPGSTYAVGFVRTYAEYLGLDSQEVLRRFREEVAEVNGQTQLVFPAAATEGKFPGGAILLLSLLLAGVAYGGWYYLSDRQVNVLDLIPKVPEQIMALVSGGPAPQSASDETGAANAEREPMTSANSAASEPETAPVVTEPLPKASEAAEAAGDVQAPTATAETRQEHPAESPTEGAAAPTEAAGSTAVPDAPTVASDTPAIAPPSPQPGAETQPEAPLAEPAPDTGADDVEAETTVAAIPAAPAAPVAESDAQTFGAANTESRIVLRARLESWVQVTDSSDTPLLTRVLRAGDSYQVPNQPGLTLATGNAGGLDIIVDGRVIPSLGPVGVVRRDVVLDPERLVAGTAMPE